MPSSPEVSIIVPVHNNEEQVEAALKSCLAQTLENIEIICVDDASTDRSTDVIEAAQQADRRIRLLRLAVNSSPFQARRRGVQAALAPYVLFLDGDDELLPGAAEKTLRRAQELNSDLVGFGIDVVAASRDSVADFERRLQPRYAELSHEAVLPGLFPPEGPVQMQVWRYLFRTELVRLAYSRLPGTLRLYRADDLPISFLAAAAARQYSSVPDKLYRYHFQRGPSGRRVETTDQFAFYLHSIDALDALTQIVRQQAAHGGSSGETLLASYEAAKLTVIGNVVKYLPGLENPSLAASCLEVLHQRVSEQDTVRAMEQRSSGPQPQTAPEIQPLTGSTQQLR